MEWGLKPHIFGREMILDYIVFDAFCFMLSWNYVTELNDL